MTDIEILSDHEWAEDLMTELSNSQNGLSNSDRNWMVERIVDRLAEGRKRCAEEQDKRWIDKSWELYKGVAEQAKKTAEEAWNAAQACLGDFGDGLARWDSTFEAWWEGREK